MDETQNQNSGFLSRLLGRTPTIVDKLVIGFFCLLFLYIFYVSLDANKYRAQVRVVDGQGIVGVNPTSESLDFGDLSRGTSAVRRVEIANNTFMPMYIVAVKTGSIASLIDIKRNFFRLAPGETVSVDYSMYMPASAEINKLYEGRVYLLKMPII
jgi:hypothetical protein